MRQSHFAAQFWHFGIAARQEIRILTVASANKGILGSVEYECTAGIVERFACRQVEWTFGQQTAVVPINIDLRHCHLRHIVACRECILNHFCIRARFRKQWCRRALHLNRIFQVQCLKHRMEYVASHIAKCASAEIPPSAEVPWSVNGIIRTHRCRADKCIPVERRRHLGSFLRTFKALRPDRTVGKCFHASHFAYHAVPNPVAHLAHTVGRCTLVTHLCCHTMLCSQFGQKTRLIHGVSEWLFAIDMLACRQCFGADDSMSVIGCCTYHSIALIEHLGKHLLIIVITLGFGIALKHMLGIFPVHVAQAYDIFGFKLAEHCCSSSANTYS